MNRTLTFAIILNWVALIASAALIFNIDGSLPGDARSAAIVGLACLFVAIAMLTAMGAAQGQEKTEIAPKLDHRQVSQRMAKVMARQTAWLAEAPRIDMREAA